jgi:hypothetical protein
MHYFSNLFDKVLHMFRTCPLSIIRSISTLYTAIHASSVGVCQQTPTELAWQIPIACIQCWDTSDDGQWTCPEHVEYFINVYSVEILLMMDSGHVRNMQSTLSMYTVLRYSWWWTVDMSGTCGVLYQCIQCWDTPDDGQWTCPEHVEYFIK